MSNPLARDLDHILEKTESLWTQARGARIFLTGGTGFVGTWLTESLLWCNRRLNLGIRTALLTRDPERFRARSPHLANDSAVTMITGEAANFTLPGGSFDLAVHAATEVQSAPSAESPTGTLDRDVAATRRVLEFARDRGVRKLLFTSSGAVYGKQPTELSHVSEEYAGAPPAIDTGGAYGAGKRISEYMCACYSQVFGIDATIARLFAFIGPYLPLDSNYAAGNFLRDAMAGGPIAIGGDGTPYRSYLYAADLAIWLWTILLRGQAARPYNVGSAEEISIAGLARAIAREVAPGAEIRIAKHAAADALPPRYVPSVARAEGELGLRVWVPLDEAIRRTCDWHRSSR